VHQLSAVVDVQLHLERSLWPIEEFSLSMKLLNVLLEYWIHCGNLSNQEASRLHDKLVLLPFLPSSSLFSLQTHVPAGSSQVRVMDVPAHHCRYADI
jgi:hypothetical protein